MHILFFKKYTGLYIYEDAAEYAALINAFRP